MSTEVLEAAAQHQPSLDGETVWIPTGRFKTQLPGWVYYPVAPLRALLHNDVGSDGRQVSVSDLPKSVTARGASNHG
jgi:hypothetical protein